MRALRDELRALPVLSAVPSPFDPADAGDCRRAVARAAEVLQADPESISPTWGLYAVHPEEVEFWQADEDRMHTRLRYSRTASEWERTLLWP